MGGTGGCRLDVVVIGDSVFDGRIGKLSSEKSISVGILFVFHVFSDLIDFCDLLEAWVRFPINVPTEEEGDRVFLYFETVSWYFDVPDFFDPKDPMGL